jgi:hypothetical protein
MGVAYGGAVQAQRLGAAAQTVPANPAAEIVRLRLMIDALERRVEELEEQEITDLKDKAAEATEAASQEAKAAQFEQRLASLERAQQGNQSSRPVESSEPDSTGGSLTVVAPFTVLDESGRTIFRVDMAPQENRPRIMVGNPIGARAEIGTNVSAASIALFDTENTVRAAMIAGQTESSVWFRNATRIGAELKADSLGGALTLFNLSGHDVARVATGRGGAGIFTLRNAAALTVINAGSTPEGVGVVQAGPRMGGAIGGLGVPFAIMGRK